MRNGPAWLRRALRLAAVIAVAASWPGAALQPAAAGEMRPPPLRGAYWLNAPAGSPELTGRVSVVEFWTFACVNCRRSVPAMRRLLERYPAGGDVAVVSIHTPELDHERNPAEVRRAVEQLGIRYPVLLDPSYANWRAFGNQYWPAFYLIDRRGRIRSTHIGELHEGTSGWKSIVETIEVLRRERP